MTRTVIMPRDPFIGSIRITGPILPMARKLAQVRLWRVRVTEEAILGPNPEGSGATVARKVLRCEARRERHSGLARIGLADLALARQVRIYRPSGKGMATLPSWAVAV
jgi:hypothetical protein